MTNYMFTLKALLPNYKGNYQDLVDYQFMMVDIVKLDEALIEMYGEYEGSMKNFVESKFGEEMMKEILKLTLPNSLTK